MQPPIDYNNNRGRERARDGSCCGSRKSNPLTAYTHLSPTRAAANRLSKTKAPFPPDVTRSGRNEKTCDELYFLRPGEIRALKTLTLCMENSLDRKSCRLCVGSIPELVSSGRFELDRKAPILHTQLKINKRIQIISARTKR